MESELAGNLKRIEAHVDERVGPVELLLEFLRARRRPKLAPA
jgi:hypothetical protein